MNVELQQYRHDNALTSRPDVSLQRRTRTEDEIQIKLFLAAKTLKTDLFCLAATGWSSQNCDTVIRFFIDEEHRHCTKTWLGGIYVKMVVILFYLS